jgi:hypothetical protein
MVQRDGYASAYTPQPSIWSACTTTKTT